MEKSIIIAKGATAEFTVQRSRFIANTAAARDEREAQAFLQNVRKKYYAARHNTFAWRLCDGRQKSSDDGEPGGTAGLPILTVMERQGVAGGIVVVTRYFGGIKLGAGGLARAYGRAAALGLAASTLAELRRLRRIVVTIEYDLLSALENWSRQKEIRLADKSYAEKVTVSLLLPPAEAAARQAELIDLTGGRAVWQDGGKTQALIALTNEEKTTAEP